MKNILITGVSTGIGYHTVKLFLQKGYFVLGSVRKQADAERLKAEFGENFHPLLFDVCDPEAIQQAVKEVEKVLDGKGLAGLVNNAGFAANGPLQHMDIKDLHQQFDVNVYGVLRVVQAFLPLLGAQLPGKYPAGKIINISSVSGFVTAPFLGAYAMSKYALESMSDALRRELSIYGIDVVILEPGAVTTEIWDKAKYMDPKYMETDYAPILKNWEKMVAGSERNAVPASDVAEKVYSALVQQKPATRYIIAKKKMVMRLVKYILPDRFIDKQVTKGWQAKLDQ